MHIFTNKLKTFLNFISLLKLRNNLDNFKNFPDLHFLTHGNQTISQIRLENFLNFIYEKVISSERSRCCPRKSWSAAERRDARRLQNTACYDSSAISMRMRYHNVSLSHDIEIVKN